MTRFLRLFRRRRLEHELSGEIAAHIEERADDLIESGMDPAAARSAARTQFGNRTAILEQSREEWLFGWLESLLRDLRMGVRALGRAPLFTTAAVATLALGIGANAAIFSLIDAVLLRPLPFPNASRIVVLWERPPKTMITASLGSRDQQNPVSPINFLDWHDRTTSFEAMAAMSIYPMGLSGFGTPIAVPGLSVTAEFFQVLAVPPLLGRTFDARANAPGGPGLAVLSYGLWRSQFGADPSAVGRTVQLSGQPTRIIAVMPEGFDLPFAHADIWVPMHFSRAEAADLGRYLYVIARLKPGSPRARAQADLDGIASLIAAERPASNRGWGAGILSLNEQITGEVSTGLWLLYGAVTFVLLIAAGNVANLLMMRGAQRQREIALRTALGAGRGRIVSQLLAESLLLSLGGGLLGIGLAFLGLRALVASLPVLALPRLEGVHVDARMLAFSLSLCLVTTVLFGLAPAIASARTAPDSGLNSGTLRATGRSGRLRALLVITEVALSMVLLAGAGLLARSFLNQIGVSRGFRTDHILTMRMFFAPARYHDERRRALFLDEILNRVRALPGVESASSVNLLPMTGIVSGSGFWRLDRPEPEPGAKPTADFVVVSPGYFRVMGIPLLAGRDFDEHDTASSEPAVVVNQAFADKFFPGENPIGKHLGLNWNVEHGVIVGVCAAARQTSLAVQPQATLFLAQAQGPMYYGALVARTRLAPSTVGRAIEDAVHAADPDQAVSDVESMEQVEAQSVARPRLEAMLLAIFAGMALLLAVIGIYGVLAYSVTQRTREIGIRMALGASSPQLVGGVLRDGLKLMLAGMLAGLAASLALTRLLASLLFEVQPADPLTFASVSALLLLVGLCASLIPARRVVAVDPVRSLRWE